MEPSEGDMTDEMLAKQAITEVVYRYARAIDRMDEALLRRHPRAQGGPTWANQATRSPTKLAFTDPVTGAAKK